MEKAQKIRNIMIDHIRKGVGMKIKDNLLADEKKIIKEIISDPDIIICPADKGRAVILEDRDSYLLKMQQQLVTLLIIVKRKHFLINCIRNF